MNNRKESYNTAYAHELLLCTASQMTHYYVDPLVHNGYPMELAGVQNLIVLSTKLQTNSKTSVLKCCSIFWY